MNKDDPKKKDRTEKGLDEEARKRQEYLGGEEPGADEARARSKAREEGVPDPDAEEEMGPVAELFKTARVEAAAELSDDEAVLAEARERGVEYEGVEAAQILGISIAIIVALIVIIVLLVQAIGFARQTTMRSAAERAHYPELREQQLKAQEQLETYGVVDAEAGIYRVPIDRAMQLMVDEAWDRQTDAPAPAEPEPQESPE